MKLFKTSNIDIINDCKDMFDIKMSPRFDAFIYTFIRL